MDPEEAPGLAPVANAPPPVDPQVDQALNEIVRQVKAGEQVDPRKLDILKKMLASGWRPSEDPMAAPAPVGPQADPRAMAVKALRKPPEMELGATPPMGGPPNQYLKSAKYGGTMNPVGDAPEVPIDPNQQMQHYAEQLALQEASKPIGGASGGAKVTRAADTEVRPWAQQTDNAVKADEIRRLGMGLNVDPSQAALVSQGKVRGAPDVYRSAQSMTDEEIARMLMGQ
jgi:hypothetical protein